MAEAVASESAKYMCRVGQHKLAMLRVGEFDEQPHAVTKTSLSVYDPILFTPLPSIARHVFVCDPQICCGLVVRPVHVVVC